MAKRYKLSRVLRAISDDVTIDGRRRQMAWAAAHGLHTSPSSTFEDALFRCFVSIPESVGLSPGLSNRRLWTYQDIVEVHDLLVAEAVRLGVPMEEC